MRKRSSYRPRGVVLDTMQWVTSGFKTLPSIGDQNVILRLRNHSALESVMRGNATATDVNVLITAANMATALKHIGKGGDWSDEIRAGVDAVESLSQRARYVFTGPELSAVRLMMEIHDAQLDACTIAELEKALAIAKRGIATAIKEAA